MLGRGVLNYFNLVASFILVLLLSFMVYGASYTISGCSILNVSGATYYLNQNIINSTTSYCINISGDNIIFDCQGHTIDGDDYADYGIYIYRCTAYSTNITIRNCIVSDWDGANIYLENVNNNTIYNVTSFSSPDSGIYLYFSDYNNITHSVINHNSVGINFNYVCDYNDIINNIVKDNTFTGIYLQKSSNNLIENNIISGNSDSGGSGLGLFGADYNVIRDNYIKKNIQYDLFIDKYILDCSNYNKIYNNFLRSKYKISDSCGGNIWNLSLGVGGNYWEAYDSPSEGCYDENSDGYCDSPYSPSPLGKDFLPIFVNISPKVYFCNNCSSCTFIIQNNASSHDTVLLNADIINSSISYCINFKGIDQINFDCQGHTIDGDDVARSGIYLYYSYNNNITNCIVSDWDTANTDIDAYSKYNKFENITSISGESGFNLGMTSDFNTFVNASSKYDSTGFDIDSDYTKFIKCKALYDNTGAKVSGSWNTFNFCNFSHNIDEGFFITKDYNKFLNTISMFNGQGFYLYGSDYGTFINCTANYNTFWGFLLDQYSYGNIINNSVSLHNGADGIGIGDFSGNNIVTNSVSGYNAIAGVCFGTSSIDPNADNNKLINVTSYGNKYGFEISYDSDNIKIINSTVINSTSYGIYISYSDNSTILNTKIINSGLVGLYFYNSENNTFYNNYFLNNVNFQLSLSDINYWNTSKTIGPNIVGGPYVGGNFWGKPNGTGYSQTCSDLNGDGFCDNPYNLTSGNVDYLPLTTPKPFYVYPTPLNNTKISRSHILFNVNLNGNSVSGCYLNINGVTYNMSMNTSHCYLDIQDLPSEITIYSFNVSFNNSGVVNYLETRHFIYYPYVKKGTMGVAPFLSFIAIVISLLLIYLI